MRILFFLVHPAKFHFHRVQINELISRGHNVDILITKKDILEELVQEEGWEYTNIFPEGRKIPGLHVYLGAFISLLRTVYRLLKYTKGKKYDLFIGDLLTIVGRLKRVPALYPTDDVLIQVPEQAVFLATTNQIIAPRITGLPVAQAKPGEVRSASFEPWKKVESLQPVFAKDRFRTSRKSRLKIKFADNSLIALGPNSIMEVSSYLFNKKPFDTNKDQIYPGDHSSVI